jgi:hypothetical protein
MNTLRYVDVGSRLTGWLLARKFDKVTRRADTLFRETCPDPDLVEYMVSLPLAGLPEVRTALVALPGQPDQQALEEAVRKVITQGWRQLSPVQIDHAVDVYLCCLGRALLPVSQARPTIGQSVLRTRTRARALGAEG